MTPITITIAGVPRVITDVATYRGELKGVTDQLKNVFAGFDPARPERLFACEGEIIRLVNRAEDLREIIERCDAAETSRSNILAAYAIVKKLTEEKP